MWDRDERKQIEELEIHLINTKYPSYLDRFEQIIMDNDLELAEVLFLLIKDGYIKNPLEDE